MIFIKNEAVFLTKIEIFVNTQKIIFSIFLKKPSSAANAPK
ncbi:hypothetical protein BDW_06540 [Bdellovibrio bacteriovorus W]|nr:hypothetical protein BDW_06540 [Bdellovibrio bacteriovorus W]